MTGPCTLLWVFFCFDKDSYWQGLLTNSETDSVDNYLYCTVKLVLSRTRNISSTILVYFRKRERLGL